MVKPFVGPNWPLQPAVTLKVPQALGLVRSLWLAGAPVMVKLHGVAALPVLVLIPNDHVQLVSAALQTRLMPATVQLGMAAGAAKTVLAERMAAMVAVVNCILIDGWWAVCVDGDIWWIDYRDLSVLRRWKQAIE